MEWRNVYKIVDTGKSIVLYISTVRAFIWPKSQIRDVYGDIEKMLKKHVKPGKIKISRKG